MPDTVCFRRKLLIPVLAMTMLTTGYAALAWAYPQEAARDAGMVRTEMAYPTGDKATSVVLLERFMPDETRVGQAFDYTVRLTNLTDMEIRDLVLTEQLPAGLDVTGVEPQPESRGDGTLTWKWANLAARGSRTLRVRGSAARPESLTCCAKVTFAAVSCATTRIVQPELVLTKTTPPEVVLCDPITLEMVVRNNGTGVARNVRIVDTLPEGWTTESGQASLVAKAGDLAAGESRRFTATIRSSRAGRFTNTARATEDGGLTAEASSTTVVHQPVLAVSKSGPERRYIGRPATFEITVANTGDAPARDTVLLDTIPAGAQFVSASDGGQATDSGVRWDLGTLAPNAKKTVRIALKLMQKGTIRNVATARAYCAEASAVATVDVRGIPAILLEVIDVADPIEVGNNETYEIAVVNQGSANGTNIRITCTVPPEEEYVSSTGPTKASVDGPTVTFAPLASLAPGAKVTYKVVVKGVAAADVRFKVSMTSDQAQRPVEETESTNVY